MDLWLKGYEHQPVNAGLNVTAGRPKAVLHTTETGPGSLDALVRHWRANPGAGLPHFVADGDRWVQLLPLDVAAYTARNDPSGFDINRSGPAIQVEIVGYADRLDGRDEERIARWLADLVLAGLPINVAQHPRFYGAGEGITLAVQSSPVRELLGPWDAFNGWCGHQHLQENDHWDPGHIDADRIERLALQYLAGGAGPNQEDWLMADSPQFKYIAAALKVIQDHQAEFEQTTRALADEDAEHIKARQAEFETTTRELVTGVRDEIMGELAELRQLIANG